jgi:hypothetical protein
MVVMAVLVAVTHGIIPAVLRELEQPIKVTAAAAL